MDRLLLITLALMIITGAFILTTCKDESQAVTGRLLQKAFIPSSHIQDMAYENFQKAISENKSALIFFYDNSCDSCISQIAEIEGMMDFLNANNPNIFNTFTYFEYDFNTGLRDKFDVTSHHTLILIKGGEEVMRTTELVSKDDLLGRINS